MPIESNKEPLIFIRKISEIMQEHNMHYFYRGYFTQEIIVDILTLVEKNLLGNHSTPKVRKKIYNLLVEALQNITRHQVETNDPGLKNTSIVSIQRRPDRYLLATGNLINNRDIPTVRNRLNHINSLEDSELKSFYKSKLIEGKISEKGGAGLGFIDIARKSGSKIAYDFYELNEDISYFYFRMEVVASKDKPEGFETIQFSYPLDYLKALHKAANNERISLIYNHNLNMEKTDNLLEHLKKQLSDTAKDKMVIYNITFDMLNILVRYTLSTAGMEDSPIIFFLKEENAKLWLNAGCYLNKNNLKLYEEKIIGIKKMHAEVKAQQNNEERMKKLQALQHISYNFLDIDSQTAFLSIRLSV